MKRTSHLLTALAVAGVLSATAFGQAVSVPSAPKAPSAPGPAGAESTTQGTGATGGVTNAGTRATSLGSQLAPGSIHSTGGDGSAPVVVETARPVLPPTTLPSRVVPGTPAPRTRTANPDGTHTTTSPGATTTTTTGSTTTVRKEGVDVGVPDASTGGKVLEITRPRAVPPPITTPGAEGTTTGGATTK